MSQLINIPLESYLLAQRSAPIGCLICDFENSSATQRCCRCAAPMALAHAAEKAKSPPRLLAVIGAGGAGKTVYLGMLMDMLVRRVGGLQATMCGPFSIGLQQTTTTSLASGMFPDRTSTQAEQWNWVHAKVQCSRKRRATELVLVDAPGEAWQQQADQPGAHPALGALLQRCDGLMVLADAQRLHAGDHEDDFLIHKLLSQLSEQRASPRRTFKKANRTPLALVFTKVDGPGGAPDDPESFAESHAQALLRDCQTRFPNTQSFGVSVVGGSAVRALAGSRREAPLRVEPRGVVEPLGWLISQWS